MVIVAIAVQRESAIAIARYAPCTALGCRDELPLITDIPPEAQARHCALHGLDNEERALVLSAQRRGVRVKE
jgi:hypothetical protein